MARKLEGLDAYGWDQGLGSFQDTNFEEQAGADKLVGNQLKKRALNGLKYGEDIMNDSNNVDKISPDSHSGSSDSGSKNASDNNSTNIQKKAGSGGKKRNRTSIVCTFCKKRKVKCDKGQPCLTCIKYGNDNCSYETLGITETLKWERQQETIQNEIRILRTRLHKLEEENERLGIPRVNLVNPTVDNDSIDQENQFLEYLGHNPISAHDDKTSFYENNGTNVVDDNHRLTRAHLPFDWVSLMKSDRVLIEVSKYSAQLVSLRMDLTNKLAMKKLTSGMEQKFESKNHSIEGKDDLKEYYEVTPSSGRNEENGSGSRGGNNDRNSNRNRNEVDESSPNGSTNSKCSKSPTYTSNTYSPSTQDESNSMTTSTSTSIPPLAPMSTPKELLKQEINKNGLILGYLYIEDDLGPEKKLCYKIPLVLPNKRVLWKLLDIYFHKFYPCAPLLDEMTFIEAMIEIIGPRSILEEQPTNVKRRRILPYWDHYY